MALSKGSPRPTPEGRESGRPLPHWILAAALVALALVISATAVSVYAIFTASTTVTPNDFASDTLDPASGLSAPVSGSDVNLSWTATADTYASGHRVLRGTASGGPYSQIAEVTPRTTTTYTDSPADGTYYYVLRSYFQNWESANSNEASATVSTGACTAGNTGFLSATAQAADTGGDGDGFELNPTNAFADGGTDPNYKAENINGSGDRHRYYNYGISIPGACAVSGIEVRLDWWMDATGGTNSMDVELSWDGGTTWTAAKTDTVETTTEHTATLGGSTDTWGRTWSVADTSDANFRLRVTSIGGNARDFFLDWVPVKVYYEPPGVTILDAWTTGLTHTVSAGNNRLLLFAVGYENGSDPGVSTVTYGGQSLTPIIGDVAGTTTVGRVELWYLNEAGIAAASGNTFSVTWGGAAPADPMYAAATYKNVNQSNPISDSASNSTDASTPNPITATVNVTDGDMAVAAAIAGNSGSYAWGGGWTEGTDQTSGTTTTMSSAENAATASGTDTASATHSGPNRQAIAAAVIYGPPPPAGAVTILDAWTTGTTHTVSAGSNRLLLVGVYGEDSGAIASVNTVTWGGQTLTEIGEAIVGTGYSNLVWMGYLNEAGIAAASGSTIVATWSGTTPNESVLYAAVTLQNVDQTTPIGNSSTGTATSASTVQVASVLTVSAGDMAAYVTVSGEQGRTHTPNAGYTEGTEEDSGGVGQVASNASKVISSAGTEQPTATWSGGANNRLGIVGAVINMAP